jgi:hypothetical protein
MADMGMVLILIWYTQCEKHSKKEEALEKLRNGAKFDDVAREFSEDKARQGMDYPSIHPSIHLIPFSWPMGGGTEVPMSVLLIWTRWISRMEGPGESGRGV